MNKVLTLEIPEEVYEALCERAARAGKPVAEVASNWMAEHVAPARRGSVSALMPFYGSWLLSADERAKLEQMINDERHREEDAA